MNDVSTFDLLDIPHIIALVALAALVIYTQARSIRMHLSDMEKPRGRRGSADEA